MGRNKTERRNDEKCSTPHRLKYGVRLTGRICLRLLWLGERNILGCAHRDRYRAISDRMTTAAYADGELMLRNGISNATASR